MLRAGEILETIRMIEQLNLDIRTITLGISLTDCAHPEPAEAARRIYGKICRCADRLVAVGEDVSRDFGIPIVNQRIAVTPVALVAQGRSVDDMLRYARALDSAAGETGVHFIGGYTALVQKGLSRMDGLLLDSLPLALSSTERLCASVNAASTRAGINMDAVARMGGILLDCAARTASRDGLACAKLVIFCNAVEDNPFMAGAFHGPGEPECALNVGISGPGVVKAALESIPDAPFETVAETIKRVAFKITRAGQLVAREASSRLGVPFGILDLSLAPTPAVGDSVARILEQMGLSSCGIPGTTAALALLNDAVKKGGVMASTSVGGLSGAFIPVSEDEGMIAAAASGALTLPKLEAMTAVCSVGLDMVAVPGDTPAWALSALIADEMAIGMVNGKTTAVRVIPVPGKAAGDRAEFGGLLGAAPVMALDPGDSSAFIARGGRIPAPIQSLRN